MGNDGSIGPIYQYEFAALCRIGAMTRMLLSGLRRCDADWIDRSKGVDRLPDLWGGGRILVCARPQPLASPVSVEKPSLAFLLLSAFTNAFRLQFGNDRSALNIRV